MVRLVCTCELSGERFSPELLAQVTGLRFAKQNEVGEVSTLGRYRGVRTPYGAATIEVPASVAEGEELLWLTRRLLPHMDLLRDSGATDIHLYVALYHDGQCNWSLSAEEFHMIAALGIGMNVSAHEDDNNTR